MSDFRFMIPVKIQCGCGQRYSFDTEPVNGRMVSPVLCPACGADGTAAAEAIIAHSAQTQAAAAREPSGRLHIVLPKAAGQPDLSSSASSRGTPLAGQEDRAKEVAEARSKIFWGDPPKDVVRFLMMNGFDREDAEESVRAVVQERAAALRQIGIWKIGSGIALMAVPVVALLIFEHYHVIIFTLFMLTVAVGFWGAWKFLKGSVMVVFPKSVKGDVADK